MLHRWSPARNCQRDPCRHSQSERAGRFRRGCRASGSRRSTAAVAQARRRAPSRLRERSCGIRAAGVSGRGENGKTWAATMSQSSSSFRLFSAISSVSVGNPAMRSAPIVAPGRAALMRSTVRTASDAAVAPLHALEDQVVAGLQRQVEVGQEPGLARRSIRTAPRRFRRRRATTRRSRFSRGSAESSRWQSLPSPPS